MAANCQLSIQNVNTMLRVFSAVSPLLYAATPADASVVNTTAY